MTAEQFLLGVAAVLMVAVIGSVIVKRRRTDETLDLYHPTHVFLIDDEPVVFYDQDKAP